MISAKRMLHRRKGTLSMVFLAATLGLTTILAYEALMSARSHRLTAENTLRDYAEIAAWEFARRSRDVLGPTVYSLLEPARQLAPLGDRGRLPSPARVREAIEARGWGLMSAHTFFSFDLRDGAIATDGERESAALSWMADTLRAHLREADGARQAYRFFTVKGATATTDPDVFVYTFVDGANRRPRAVYGMIAGVAMLNDVFTQCSREDLIPPAIAGDLPTDSLLYLSVYSPFDTKMYESPVEYPMTFTAVDTVGQAYGGLTVRAALRPDAAETLIIGGLPSSRLPILIGLLLLTIGVGAATLLQTRREQELSSLRDDFVSGVSHELRTPLAQIRMFGELLDDGRLRNDAERDRSATVINREARRLTHLVDNILHFSRLRRASAKLVLADTDLGKLIGETVEAFAPLARARTVKIRELIDDDVVVQADRDALSQVILNLLDNALKYGPTGQTVTVGLAQTADTARLWVEDEGPGVPETARERVWDPYRRLDRDKNTTVVGSGIGLSVVRELTELHGGRTWVESGHTGARFVVELPSAHVLAAATGPE